LQEARAGGSSGRLRLQALYSNTNGFENTASSAYALANDTFGANNTAIGYQAGFDLTTGSNNIDVGDSSLSGTTRRK
jgi:hypothetical protein